MQHIVGGKVWIQFLKGSVVQNRAEPVIGSNGQMYPAIGAYIQAFGPNLAGGAAAAFFTFNKLRLHPAGRSRTSIAADFQLEAALLLADREQLFNGIHP